MNHDHLWSHVSSCYKVSITKDVCGTVSYSWKVLLNKGLMDFCTRD